MRKIVLIALVAVFALAAAQPARAWGGRGHRIIAAIAMALIPEKAARLNTILHQLEIDNNFIDAASYPDEYIRAHDPQRTMSRWHFADLPDDNAAFECGDCLFTALANNLAIVKQAKGDKAEAVAIAWVLHLAGDLHQPLHMAGRLRGGNDFRVTYRGSKECPSFGGNPARVQLHSVWDDCLVEELAHGRDARTMAKSLLGTIKSFKGRPELQPGGDQPWLAWGQQSHVLSNTVAFDGLADGADLGDAYIKGHALDTVRQQLRTAGIRLAYLLDQVVK